MVRSKVKVFITVLRTLLFDLRVLFPRYFIKLTIPITLLITKTTNTFMYFSITDELMNSEVSSTLIAMSNNKLIIILGLKSRSELIM